MEILKRKVGCLLLVAMFLGLCGSLHGQVTIGSTNPPDKAKLLHLESVGGLGLPRVELVSRFTLEPFIATTDTEWTTAPQSTKDAHTGLMVYNMNDDPGLSQGVYVWDGDMWVRSRDGARDGRQWFYMPSFNLPMVEEGTASFDLYGEYRRQFTGSLNSVYRASSSSVTTVPSPDRGLLYEKEHLDYVVVHYDRDVIAVTGIDDQGVMSYEVLDADPGALSFMTIIFVVKE